jgi:hypothetical protein
MSWLRVDRVGDRYKITDLDWLRNRKDIVYTVDLAELPAWINEAISILDLCEYNKPLDGVGEHLRNKLGEDCYYISKIFLNEYHV